MDVDHDIAEEGITRRRAQGIYIIHGKGKDIGGAVFPAILAVESPDPVIIGKEDAHFYVIKLQEFDEEFSLFLKPLQIYPYRPLLISYRYRHPHRPPVRRVFLLR